MKKILLILLLLIPVNIYAIEFDKDVSSGIILSGEDGAVDNDTVLSVNEINTANTISVARNFGLKNYKAYNISLLSSANRIVPNAEVTLSFPIPANYNITNTNQIFVLIAGSDGNVERVYATYNDQIGLYEDLNIKNGYAIINTSYFSLDKDTTFLIGTTANLSTTRSIVIDNPNTVDSNSTNILIISIIAIGGIMLLITKLYLDNKN